MQQNVHSKDRHTHTHTRTKFKRKGICCQHSYIHWWFQLVRITFSSWFIVNAHSSIASIKWHSYGIAGPLHPGKCPAPVCSMYRPINVCSIFFSYCIIHIRSQRVSFQFEILGRSISLVEMRNLNESFEWNLKQRKNWTISFYQLNNRFHSDWLTEMKRNCALSNTLLLSIFCSIKIVHLMLLQNGERWIRSLAWRYCLWQQSHSVS